MATLESGLQTIDLGTQGWNAIFSSNMQLLDEFILAIKFIYGLNLEWLSNSSVKVYPGGCKDDQDSKVILLDAETTISLPDNLDTGSEQSDTWYFIWIAKNPASGSVICLFSASPTSPTLPVGYTLKRRIGSVRNNNSSQLINFAQLGAGTERQYQYLAAIDQTRVLSGGTAANFTAVSCLNYVPSVTKFGNLRFSNEGTQAWLASIDGTTISDKIYERDSQNLLWYFPSAQTLYYRRDANGASAYIEVTGWMESL